MGASVNKVTILGNLGQNPQIRYTQTGTAVCSFTVATSDAWNDKNGQRQERVEWVRISVWGKLAETCGEYLAKGRQVFVEGRLKTTEADKNGVKVYYTEVVAQNVQFLGGRGQGGGQQQKQSEQHQEPPTPTEDYQSDDVPF